MLHRQSVGSGRAPSVQTAIGNLNYVTTVSGNSRSDRFRSARSLGTKVLSKVAAAERAEAAWRAGDCGGGDVHTAIAAPGGE